MDLSSILIQKVKAGNKCRQQNLLPTWLHPSGFTNFSVCINIKEVQIITRDYLLQITVLGHVIIMRIVEQSLKWELSL
jgi:hypothetical protein